MVDLVPLILEPKSFENIYEVLKPHLKKRANKTKLHEDLSGVIFGAYINDWVSDFERGPTVGQRTDLLAGFAHDIECLIKRFGQIEKYYPALECPETGQKYSMAPRWLSPFMDKFDIKELKTILENLRGLESQGKKLLKHKKPRLSGREYYIKELIRVFEKHTGTKAKVNKNYSTPFSDFVAVFLSEPNKKHAQILLKNKFIENSALYDECQKIKKRS